MTLSEQLDSLLGADVVSDDAATLAAHRIPVDGLATADRRALLRDGIARADAAYDEGTAGIVFLTHGRRSIRAAASMYREILRQIERDGLGARRPWRSVVPRRRKAALVARALLRPGGRIVSRNGR